MLIRLRSVVSSTMSSDGIPGSQSRYRFADFEYFSSGELRRSGRDLPLPFQAGQVLHALLSAGGEVVTREQMRQVLWPDRAHGDFDGGLNTIVCKLRQVLDDDGVEPRLIGTLPKRGYRLLVPVEQVLIPLPAEPDRHGSHGASPPDPGPAGSSGPSLSPSEGNDAATASPQSPLEAPRPPRHRPLWMTAGAFLLLLAAGLTLLGVMTGRDLRFQAHLWAHEGLSPFHRLAGWTRRNPLGMEFVRIPPGSFTMGNGAWRREMRPAHAVILTRPFLLQTTEVTVGQFRAFVEATSYRTYAEFSDGAKVFKGPQATAAGLSPWEKRPDANWRNPYYFQSDDCPVVAVDWNDIQIFLAWLNQIDPGKGYRLPTEAEWEYASRGGAREAWMVDPDEQAWHVGNSGSHAQPVALRLPNPYGLHDMLGNVWEWCQDWYAAPFAGPFPRVDPGGPAGGDRKVVKGASWASTRTHLQWTNREGRYPEECCDDLGFRLAADGP